MNNEMTIDEGLIRTVELKRTVDYIKKQLVSGKRSLSMDISDSGKIRVKVSKKYLSDPNINPDIKSDVEWVIQLINNFGYFPSQLFYYSGFLRPEKYDESKLNNILTNMPSDLAAIIFDSKFPNAVSEKEIPDRLYHLSDENCKEKILRLGLSPKTANKIETHPERVYFCKTPECIKKLVDNKFFRKKSKTDSYALFEIDTTHIKTSISFYPDPSHKDALFIYKNINPKYIKFVEMRKKNN